MKEAIELVRSNKVYKKIFLEVYNKYKKYGKVTGSFVLKSSCPEDDEVLINFDQNVIINKKAKIKCSVVEELFKRKLKENESFIELMKYVIGGELVTNKEEKAKENARLENFLERVIETSKNGSGRTWFMKSIEGKSLGYNIIIRKYNECINETMLNELVNDLALVTNSLSTLPYIADCKENIAVFAAKMTKDPSFLRLWKLHWQIISIWA